MALCPQHPKRDQNPKLSPLSETTSNPVCFIWESPLPPPGFSHNAMDASSAQCVNILETFNTYQYIIYIFAPTISTSLDFRDLVPVKGRLMCIAYVQTWFRSLCFFLSRSLVTPRHRCVIMNKIVNESLLKICPYQKNVPQHYYLLDYLVINLNRIFYLQ